MAKTARKLTDEERRALREQGYRPVEIWVPDLDDPKTIAELREEARQIAESDRRTGMDKVLEAYAADLLAHEPDYEW
jgi:hypothetical protein